VIYSLVFSITSDVIIVLPYSLVYLSGRSCTACGVRLAFDWMHMLQVGESEV